MRGGGSFAGQVYDPFLELVMMRRDNSAPLAIKGVANEEFCVAAAIVIWRSRVSMPYCWNRASRHFCAPSSVLFNVDGYTVRQASAFVAC